MNMNKQRKTLYSPIPQEKKDMSDSKSNTRSVIDIEKTKYNSSVLREKILTDLKSIEQMKQLDKSQDKIERSKSQLVNDIK